MIQKRLGEGEADTSFMHLLHHHYQKKRKKKKKKKKGYHESKIVTSFWVLDPIGGNTIVNRKGR